MKETRSIEEGRELEGLSWRKEAKCLVWQDVNVMVEDTNFMMRSENEKTLLLKGLSGFALPRRIMAIMGPSGSGKSTLLDALSGRLSPNVTMTGSVLLNGKQRSISSNISYVTQEDFLLGTLTVRETLTYSAHLRLPKTMSKQEINVLVEETMTKMGLQDCANTNIGNWHLRGISGGEKRRLSVGLEVLTQPSLMFLDEPTSGLDSASAYFVVEALRSTALEGKIVIFSIHQPSSYIFDLFDDLCLLSSGETIYFGEAKLALKFFAEAGFPCPTRRNPADHFLKCINSDFDKISATLFRSQKGPSTPESSSSRMNYMKTEHIRQVLIERYKVSEYSILARKGAREVTLDEEEIVSGGDESMKNSSRSWWRQLHTLTSRSIVNMHRDIGYYWLRIGFYILVTVAAGTLYFDIGLSNSAYVARSKCYTYVYSLLICLAVGGIPSFIEEIKVAYYERLNGHYGEGVYVLANIIASFPFLVITGVSTGTIIHFMVKFHPGFSHYVYLCINLFCCVSIMECVAMIVSLLVPNFMMGIGVSAAIIMLLTMTSGLCRPLAHLPKVFWRYPMGYISFTHWAVQGQFKNDMIGLEFEPSILGDPKIKGEQVLKTTLGIKLNQSKWWDLAALLFLLLGHRIIFFLVLKYKERARFALRRFFASKSGGDQLTKMSSFGRGAFGSSRRQKPRYSLSSQEGLESTFP